MRKEILRLERVSCRERGVTELTDFNMRIYEGDVMGLLPINNHGLRAFLELLQYNTALSYGYVYYRGRQINTWRNNKYRRNNIGLIQSESCLVEGLTVADNIFVLRPGFKNWYIRSRKFNKLLAPFLENLGVHISADAYIKDLSKFERIIVDVLKSVVADCKLIVLRDIGSYINEHELQKIHKLIRFYSEQGFSFLCIDFHFEELRQICDKVALMSNGRIVKVLRFCEEHEKRETAEALLYYTNPYSDKVRNKIVHNLEPVREKKSVFELQNLSSKDISNLSFSVSEGECLVLQEVDNYVFQELLSIMLGETEQARGEIFIGGVPAKCGNNRDIAVIQELPSQTMIFRELSYLDNLVFTLDHRLPEVWSNQNVQSGIIKEYSSIFGEDIFYKRVDHLSEMEKYRLVYMRIAIQKPKLVFCVQPFRRADMELRMLIWEQIKMLLDKNIAVVILAVNLADSLSLATRLIRLKQGKVDKIYERADFSDMPITAPWVDVYRQVDSER